ncbi:MAG: glycerol-3-phosphate 1-O-acyltransferase PlsY [Planctomycetota bacterium]
MSVALALYLVAAFLLGAIPFGFLVARLKGFDIRTVGSGNIGATNVGRVLGRRWGGTVFLLDFLKGLLPVLGLRAGLLGPLAATAPVGVRPELLAALAPILGHIYSPFLGFRGGKGVATSLGAFVALSPVESSIALVAWAVVLKISATMALASLTGAWLLVALLVLLRGRAMWSEERDLLVVALLLALLITWRHRSNITRLLRGEEAKVGRRKRPSSESDSSENSGGR